MNEQVLIDTIGNVMEEGLRARKAVAMEDIARESIARCGGSYSVEAVADLVKQVFTHQFEPWNAPPGTRPRLRGEIAPGVQRLGSKASPMELLHQGRERQEPLETTIERITCIYPSITRGQVTRLILDYDTWLKRRIGMNKARARELKQLHELARPAIDEDPSLTIGEALRIEAERGSEAARRELASFE